MKNITKLFLSTTLFLCAPGLVYSTDNAKTDDFSGVRDEKAANHPFEKSESRIDNDSVVGLRIDKGNITLLSDENTFYSENQNDETFSKMNVFSQYPNLISVEFKNLTLSAEQLENIYNFISGCNIKNISFNSCVVNEADVHFISDIIKKLDTLVSVTVKFLKTPDGEQISNSRQNENSPETSVKTVALSMKGTEEITAAISERKDLASLNVAFNNISVTSSEHLKSAIGQSPNMRMLSLCWEDMQGSDEDKQKEYKELSETIGTLAGLKTLYLSIMTVPENSFDDLFQNMGRLHEVTNLTILIRNLGTSKNAYEYVVTLGKAITEMKNLASLRMRNMKLPASAMQALAQSLANHSKLAYLDLSDNTVSKEVGSILSESLKGNDELKVLVMRQCGIDAETFSEIAKVFPESSASILCFGNNEIKDGIKGLQLASCTSLRCFDLANNGSSADAIMEFIKSTVEHASLQKVDLRNNCNMSEKRDEIDQLKAKSKSMILYLLDSDLPDEPNKENAENKKNTFLGGTNKRRRNRNSRRQAFSRN